MRQYELMVIASPDFKGDDEKAGKELITRLLSGQTVEKLDVKPMGKKQLAYEIRKTTEGWYFLATFDSKAVTVGPIEQQAKLTPHVLRYLLTKRSE